MELSTTYLGLKLSHPFIAGSGPLTENLDSAKRLEDAGAAAIVMHSLFEEQLEREAGTRPQSSHFPKPSEFPSHPDDYLVLLSRISATVQVPIIASLNGTAPKDWLKYSKLIELAGADALEINIYHLSLDPRETGAEVEERLIEFARVAKSTVKIPVAVKLSPFYSAPLNIVTRLDALGVDGIVLFNRFYQPEIHPDALITKPMAGLSTSSELPIRLHWIAILSGRIRASLAVTGGVHTAEDAGRAIAAGAHAVQMVSALLEKGPERLCEIRFELEEWMERHHYKSVEKMRGCLSLQNCPSPAGDERANYARLLQSWRK